MKVCVHCFNDLELKQFIISNSVEKGRCDSCSDGLVSELLDIKELLDFFAEIIKIYKIVDKGIPLVELIQHDWNLFSDKSDCQKVLRNIISTLKTEITDPLINVNYIDEITECTSYWEALKEEIKWKKRFLTNIVKLEDLGWHRFFKRTVILNSSKPLFRARLHYSGDQKLFNKTDMGCPEGIKASAGRANPQGIPYLYLSEKIETTLYEIRAAYLDEVSVGEFKIKDGYEIILVDFTESTSAFLNVDDIIEYTKSMLLKKFISADLSIPIRRYDSEIEYIPTQFICEFIRHYSGIPPDFKIHPDGILFNSSLHNGGKNIVLFEQTKVECISVAMHRVTKVEIKSKSINIKKKIHN